MPRPATATRPHGRNTRPQLERRRITLKPADFRAVEKDSKSGLPQKFTAIVLRYLVIDDYGTRFTPGVFDLSMGERMPRICWAHDWTNPLGRWTDVVQNNDELLELRGEFDSFDDVPDARRAASQLASGTIDQFSVGFYREEDREAEDPKLHGIWDIVKGELVEASPVLLGAVPGTAVTGLRQARSGLYVPLEEVEHIIVSLGAGQVDVVDATVQARELADAGDSTDGAGGSPEGGAQGSDDTPAPAATDGTPSEPPADGGEGSQEPPAAPEGTPTPDEPADGDEDDEVDVPTADELAAAQAQADEDAALLAELDDAVSTIFVHPA